MIQNLNAIESEIMCAKVEYNRLNRQSNFELLRIVSMFLVLVIHADYFSTVQITDEIAKTHPVSVLMRYLIETMALVSVNVFILISGYFGIKVRWRSVASFIFMVLFWRLGIMATVWIGNLIIGVGEPAHGMEVVRLMIPGYKDWFVGAYIILLFIAPMLNSYIEKSSVRQLWKFCLLYCTFQIIFCWIADVYNSEFLNGFSVLSLIGLYVIGSAIHKTKMRQGRTWRFGIYGYLVVSLVFGFIFWSINYSGRLFWSYNGLGLMIASVFLFIGFRYIKIQSKFINMVASSAFAVYLFHMHPLIRGYYWTVIMYLYDHYNTIEYIVYISLFMLAVFTFAVLVDFIRKWCWGKVLPFLERLVLMLKKTNMNIRSSA